MIAHDFFGYEYRREDAETDKRGHSIDSRCQRLFGFFMTALIWSRRIKV